MTLVEFETIVTDNRKVLKANQTSLNPIRISYLPVDGIITVFPQLAFISISIHNCELSTGSPHEAENQLNQIETKIHEVKERRL